MPFDPNLPPNNVQVKAQGLRGQLNGLYHEGVRQAAYLFFQAIARQLGSHVSGSPQREPLSLRQSHA
jgi:hypothetical protein